MLVLRESLKSYATILATLVFEGVIKESEARNIMIAIKLIKIESEYPWISLN